MLILWLKSSDSYSHFTSKELPYLTFQQACWTIDFDITDFANTVGSQTRFLKKILQDIYTSLDLKQGETSLALCTVLVF